MTKSEALLKIENFQKALSRLEEGVKEAKNELDKDGVIQRFEFTVELLWKALRAILLYNGIECYSPRSCVKEAFKANIIPDEEVILDMIEDRNISSHVYNEEKSEALFERIKNVYLKYLINLNLKV
ncbi:nucleotidyltransferase substrate binding protein [Caminibacter pacificus]|uniref:Nucleotidyltransferase n=1 Tax=Caminibacter pacificus TaxID=1424653 RepID=A0AAJ4UY16_9BACT|nr:nucleotidyltransferase substrate binding protein [Caminibacter pacificus]QCI27602.1 nucleotidyltransferase [Caminibacter pacificus]ROR40219.1 nucleotidyltransferase substrate binding protein (TIGR01987 family) [Caminibacter pacificus]